MTVSLVRVVSSHPDSTTTYAAAGRGRLRWPAARSTPARCSLAQLSGSHCERGRWSTLTRRRSSRLWLTQAGVRFFSRRGCSIPLRAICLLVARPQPARLLNRAAVAADVAVGRSGRGDGAGGWWLRGSVCSPSPSEAVRSLHGPSARALPVSSLLACSCTLPRPTSLAMADPRSDVAHVWRGATRRACDSDAARRSGACDGSISASLAAVLPLAASLGFTGMGTPHHESALLPLSTYS